MSVMDTEHTLRNGLRFKTRPGTSDFNTVNACAYEDEYHLENADVQGKVIFDIGAHIGGVAIWLASRGAFSVAVEPVPENAELIRVNAYLNGLADRVHVVEAAIGTPPQLLLRYMWNGENKQPLENEVAKIHSFIGNTGLDHAGYPADREIWVPTTTLTQLVRTYGTPVLIKTDCEGGEWQLFEDPAIADVPLIVGEWHEMNKGYTEGDMGEWVTTEAGRRREDIIDLIGDTHVVTFNDIDSGAGAFSAVKR